MIHGDPGSGKSIVLRLLAERLKKQPDITVGAINHPQSNMADFYRELGDIFAVPLRPSNRWGGFKALRERWFNHLESSHCRPVLLIDEAQEMTPQVLSELRLLASARFDSQPLLCIIIAGDARLIEKLRREELIPLGSRIRTRLATEFASRDELLACLDHLLGGAGNASLMTPQLRHTLCDHAAGNYRILTTMAAELLAAAAQRDLPAADQERNHLLELPVSDPGAGSGARSGAQGGLDRSHPQRIGGYLAPFQLAWGIRLLGRRNGGFGGTRPPKKSAATQKLKMGNCKNQKNRLLRTPYVRRFDAPEGQSIG